MTALVAMTAVLVVSCAKLGSGGTHAQPADIYALSLNATDVRSLLGDNNWWPGAPSFDVRPLNAATAPFTQRFSITQRFIHIGSAEELVARYTVFDKTTSATTYMTDVQNAFGPSPSSPREGDQVLYYGLAGSGGAPYVTRTFVRVGQIVVQLIWARKDPSTTVQQLGRNAARAVDLLKKGLAGNVRPSIQKVDPKLLPNPGLDITYLGSVQLPIEAWVVMTHAAIPGPVVQLLHDMGITDFAYGDYALNNDTHMEVRTATFTFPTSDAAGAWAAQFGPGKPDASGVDWTYIPIAGSVEGAGEYHYYISAGTHGAMLVCASTIDGDAASRACEAPMERTAISWRFALTS